MRKTRVYVDTSVFGGAEDEEFAVAGRRFFQRVHDGEYIVLISQVTQQELSRAPMSVQSVLSEIPSHSLVFIPSEPEAMTLAQAYLDANIVGPSSVADALHVATATVAGADLILSWNFRHIVNYDRIHKYNGVNALRGYPPIEIHSPMEMSDVDKDQDL